MLKAVKGFFRTNQPTCKEWLLRIRFALVEVAAKNGFHAFVVRLTWQLLHEAESDDSKVRAYSGFNFLLPSFSVLVRLMFTQALGLLLSRKLTFLCVIDGCWTDAHLWQRRVDIDYGVQIAGRVEKCRCSEWSVRQSGETVRIDLSVAEDCRAGSWPQVCWLTWTLSDRLCYDSG